MRPEAAKLLADVIDSCAVLHEWRSGRTLDEYSSDRQFRRAVERELEIVGEALNQLVNRDPDTANRIEDVRRIIGLRNRLVHGYATIDDRIVWAILDEPVARLLEQTRSLLRGGPSLEM